MARLPKPVILDSMFMQMGISAPGRKIQWCRFAIERKDVSTVCFNHPMKIICCWSRGLHEKCRRQFAAASKSSLHNVFRWFAHLHIVCLPVPRSLQWKQATILMWLRILICSSRRYQGLPLSGCFLVPVQVLWASVTGFTLSLKDSFQVPFNWSSSFTTSIRRWSQW